MNPLTLWQCQHMYPIQPPAWEPFYELSKGLKESAEARAGRLIQNSKYMIIHNGILSFLQNQVPDSVI